MEDIIDVGGKEEMMVTDHPSQDEQLITSLLTQFQYVSVHTV